MSITIPKGSITIKNAEGKEITLDMNGLQGANDPVFWKNIITAIYQLEVSDFNNAPASYKNVQIDGFAINTALAYQVDQIVMNSIGINEGNDSMIMAHGQAYGMYPKTASFSYVDILFTGTYNGTIIPRDLMVSDVTGQFVFFTDEENALGSTLSKVIRCRSREPLVVSTGANTVTKLGSAINGLTITNPQSSIVSTPEETNAEFRDRIIKTAQTSRPYSFEYLRQNLLKAGLTANNFSITYPNASLEVIVNGGDDAAVARAIWESGGGMPDYTVSNPSNGDQNRVKNVTLNLYSNVYAVKFTQAMLTDFKIDIVLSLSVNISLSVADKVLTPIFEEFFANLPIGALVSRSTLDDLVYGACPDIGITTDNIIILDYVLTKNNIVVDFTEFNTVPIVKDELLILSNVDVTG